MQRISNENPYEPPRPKTSASVEDLSGDRASILGSMFPASLSVVVMLLVWAVLVSTIDGLFLMIRSPLVIWSATLFASSMLSAAVICHLWRRSLHPVSFGVSFAVFSITLAVLEGDSSSIQTRLSLAVYCVTLVVLPGTMFVFVSWRLHRRNESAHSKVD